MFWLIKALLVTINNQSRSWSSIHRCSDWSGPYVSLSTINEDLDHPYTDVLTDQCLTCHYQQSMKILIIHTQMFWLIKALLVTINNQSRSWSSIHRCTNWSRPYLSLSTINQDLDHPYTDVLADLGLTCHYQQSIKILIIHIQMFWLIKALLVTINNQSRSWSSIHRCSGWSGPYLSLSTINEDLDHPYTDFLTDQGLTCHYQQSIKILIIHKKMFWLIRALLVTISNQWRSWSSIHRCSDRSGPYLSLSTINQDLDHPYTDVLTDQGLTCHYQQSIKILIIHTQIFWLIRALLVTINNQSRSWSSIHRCSDWSVPYLSLSTINHDLDHPYTDVLTDQGLTCHYQQSIKILIINTQMFWLIRVLLVTINNQSRSWSSIHRCSDWSRPYLSLSTINPDLDHPYTDVLTDQGLTCHYQQSMKILIIRSEMFWQIRVLLVTINNQWRSWSSIHRCSDWSRPYLSLSTINQDLDHPYTDVLTDQGLTCHYQQSMKILIIRSQMFWLIRVLLVTINNQSRSWSSIHRCSDWSGPYLSLSTINQDLDHPYTDVLTDQGLTCHYQQSIKILIIHTQMFWLIKALLVTINNQSRSWSSIHRCSDWSGSYLSLSTINQDLDHPYTDVLTDQGLTGHYQQSIKILIIHTQMFCLIRALLVTINNQSRSWSSIYRCSDWSGPYLSLSTINQDLHHSYTDVLTDQGHTGHYQQSIKILIIHTQMFWLIRALLVTINNQSWSWSSIHRCSDWSGPYLSLSTIKILIIHTQMFWLIRALLVTINNQLRSWSSIHRCSVWSGPYWSLSTINQDIYHPYTDVMTEQGLTCHYQQLMEIIIIHTQMFWLIRALLVIINNQSRSWSSIHRCSDWSGPYFSLSTIKILIIHTQMFWLIRALLVTINNQSRSWSSIHRCSDWSGLYLSLSTINQDLDHPYTDVLTDQGHTGHYQQSIKILISHTQMFWLIRAILVTINNQDLDHPYTDFLTDQGLTCHYQQSIKILIIHTQMFWLIRAILVTINNQDLDHPYTDVLPDQGLTCHYQQSIKILIIHTQMFWLIRALLVTINNQ